MAQRGRKPEPTAIKVLEGNPGKIELNINEPKPQQKAPKCSMWLEAEFKKEWRRIVGTDRNSICYEQYQKAQDIIDGRKIDPTFYLFMGYPLEIQKKRLREYNNLKLIAFLLRMCRFEVRNIEISTIV